MEDSGGGFIGFIISAILCGAFIAIAISTGMWIPFALIVIVMAILGNGDG